MGLSPTFNFCDLNEIIISKPIYTLDDRVVGNAFTMRANEEDRVRQKCETNWHKTWAAFNAAIRSTDDFHAFRWTLKLLKSGICVAYFKFGLSKLKLHIFWRSWVPGFAIVLIAAIVASYFGSLRGIVKERWCYSCPTPASSVGTIEGGTDDNSCSRVDDSWCRWLLFHDAVVAYLGFMIIFCFVSACFRSPGVVLAKDQQVKDNETKESSSMINTNNKPLNNSHAQRECIPKWSAKDSRGGFCGIDPILNIAREEFLVQNYNNIAGLSGTNGSNTNNANSKKKQQNQATFPSSRETFCNKCKIKRPPRCHHCSVCDRWYVHNILWFLLSGSDRVFCFLPETMNCVVMSNTRRCCLSF